MIYKVFIDGINIYDTSEELSILSGTVEQELNGAGSCEITIPYNHKYYDLAKPLTSVIDVYEGDEIIFFGRVITISTNWNREKKITAEGALTYFNDSIIRPYEWPSTDLRGFFIDVIAKHNELVVPEKRFVARTKPGDAESVENEKVG